MQRRSGAEGDSDETAATPGRENDAASDLQALLDHVPGGVSYWSREFTNVYANRVCTDAFGIVTGSIFGKTMEESLGADFFLRHRQSFDAIHRGHRQTFEIELPAPHGAFVSYEVDCVPDTRDGHESAFFMFLRDTTARKRTETELSASAQALQNSEARLRLVMDAAPALIGYVGPDMRYRFGNRAYARWFGIGPDALHGRTILEVVGEKNFSIIRPHVEAVLAGRPAHFEASVETAQGDKWVEVTYQPHVSVDGTVEGFFVLGYDCTERRRFERQLAESEQRFKTVVANVPALVGYWGMDGRLLFGNRLYTEWFGIPVDSLPGRTGDEVLGEKLCAQTRMNIRAALRGMPQRFERTFKDVSGEMRRAQVSYVPDIIDGEQHGMFVFAYDVTELSRQVEQRTSELRIAMEAAETANRVKDQIVANVSHEMRTPLHGIVGFASLGVTRLGPESIEKCRVYFERIRSSGHRLTHFVDQILILARLNSGELMPNPSMTDVVALINRVIGDTQSLFEEKGIRVRIAAAHGTLSAEVDVVLFERVMLNLVSNATKFSPSGGAIAITIASAALPSHGSVQAPAVSIRVEDQGPGIPLDEIELIFEPFVQGSRTQGQQGGTGLGLAISRRIVDLHGGNLVASNGPDRGARFDVTIPVKATPMPISFKAIIPLSG